jgi:hypothetical protein
MCPLCSKYRAGQVQARLRGLVGGADQVRFATLTLPKETSGLAERIDKIVAAFRGLRARQSWKKHVVGGAWVIEVTRGREGQHWHVHLHLLVDGGFYPQAELQAEWSAVLGELGIVDIRAIHGRQEAVRYVAKYVGKGCACKDWSDQAVKDFAVDTRGRRLYGTYGKWHKAKIEREQTLEPDGPCPRSHVTLRKVEEFLQQPTTDAVRFVPILMALGPTWKMWLSRAFPGVEPAKVAPAASEYADLVRDLYDLSTGAVGPPKPPTPAKPPSPTTGRLFGPAPMI